MYIGAVSADPSIHMLPTKGVEAILKVTSKLAAPFDLYTMLHEVVEAAKYVLDAESGSVWLHQPDTDELVMEVAENIPPVRLPMGKGLVGSAAATRQVINVPDCYADPRFNQDIDLQTKTKTRCMLTLPLVDPDKDMLVGVMQVLNKRHGVFTDEDVMLAQALSAQCVVALQRVRMVEARLEAERMRNELTMARDVQFSTLPNFFPQVDGYEVFGLFQPEGLAGGDTFDLVSIDQGIFILMGDATGHGIAPALSATQMQAMLRVAFRLGADLDDAFRHVNNQLLEDLPDEMFVTAFVGLLDENTHAVRFHSGGQGPILHFQAATRSCESHPPTSFPLAALPLDAARPSKTLAMHPGDVLAVLSDGTFEFRNKDGEEFGTDRVAALIEKYRDASAEDMAATILAEVERFARGAPQEDDITIVIVKREHDHRAGRKFARSYKSLQPIFDFTAAFFRRNELDPSMNVPVDFVIEELFTNMVKYSTESQADIRIDLRRDGDSIHVTLTDYDVEPFDPTVAPEVAVDLPAEQRVPGGLGIHLVRKLVDSIEYEYADRRSILKFTKKPFGETAG